MQQMLDFQAAGGTNRGGLPTDGNVWGKPAGDPFTTAYANTDWFSEIYKGSSFSQEHNFSVSGGGDKFNYYASLGYLDQNGLLRHGSDDLKRYNATAKFGAELTKWLKFNYSLRYVRQDLGRPTNFGGGLYEELAVRLGLIFRFMMKTAIILMVMPIRRRCHLHWVVSAMCRQIRFIIRQAWYSNP